MMLMTSNLRSLQLIKTFNEWSQGVHTELTVLDALSLQHYDALEKGLENALIDFKSNNPDVWIAFSVNIFAAGCGHVTLNTAATTSHITLLVKSVIT